MLRFVPRASRPAASALILVASVTVAACGGAGGATANPTQGGPGATTGTAPTGAAATAGSAPGGGTGGKTAEVVITGGPDAGTYSGTIDPLCTNGIVGKGGWGVQYSTADLTGEKDLTSVQLVYYASGPDPEGMFSDTSLLLTVTIGPITSGRVYDITVKTDAGESSGTGTATVSEGNPTVIKATGTTADGVKIDATVTCPKVTKV